MDATSDILDVTGFQCPLPVLKTRKRLKSLAPGAEITVIASDPAAAIDMPHFCTEQGHSLISQSAEAGKLIFRIRRKS
jgi:tRNA 2-thiouridine synthesizing protein A